MTQTNHNPQQQLLSELVTLSNEATRVRQMDTKTLQERLQKITDVAKRIPAEAPKPVTPKESTQVAGLITTLRQAPTIDALLQAAVDGVKAFLGLERVLVYSVSRGLVTAECLEEGFTPAIGEKLPIVAFGKPVAKLYEAVVALGDVHQQDLSPYQQQLMERFQVRALVSIPLMQDGHLWGILVGQKCLGTRVWQEQELKDLDRIRQELEIQLQVAVIQDTLTRRVSQESAYAGLFFRLNQLIGESLQQQTLDFYRLFRETTQELRQILDTDRAAIYRFSPDWSGEFIAESVKPGWSSVLEEQQEDEYLMRNTTTNDRCILKQLQAEAKPDTDTYLQRTQGGEYVKGKPFTKVDDIYAMNFDPCYIKRLEKYQAKAYVIVPIFSDGKAWGLLAIYQNEGPRSWEMTEVSFLQKVADLIGVAIQQADNLEQLRLKNDQISRDATRTADFSRLSYRVSELIAEGLQQESVNTASLFRDVTQELRQILKVDRSAIYRFNPDWSGEFIAESVGMGWVSVLEDQQQDEYLMRNTTTNDRCILKKLQAETTPDTDTYLQRTQGGEYAKGKSFTQVDDIYAMNFDPCYIKRLEKYQAKAYIIVPIYQGNRAWGLLAIYQNDRARAWEAGELTLLQQVAVQLGIVLLQGQYLEQIQLRTAELSYIAELERSLNTIADKMRQIQKVETIFQVATHELRQLMKVDRVAIYQFNPDWSGSFVAEAVTPGWVELVGTTVQDTYLQETQGGRYVNNETLAINNIYEAGHQPCHVEILEGFQAKSYVIVPIKQGGVLWGLLAMYQNASFRSWKPIEVNSLAQIGFQVGIAIQQAEYLTKIQAQSVQLTEAADREKKERENLQQSALRILRAIEPSFRGDLTVRAPLSEDEVGTIADGYNTTIATLRELVRQVQGAAGRVSEASSTSNTAVSTLSQQSQDQVKKLDQALQYLQQMIHSVKAVTVSAQNVEQAVQEANRVVQSGDSLAELTVTGILEIRDTVSETAKKIKRLGESSQKISRVVNLIENFATQTNLLALNAAIEATRAGEYGRGFAVVADEVRSLAYQSANATTEIERLVQEIQSGTSEVIEAMEVGISQVVRGTGLVNETRQSLQAIGVLTQKISQLVEGITQATSIQEDQSLVVTQEMADVSAIADQTSAGANHIAQAFQDLLATAKELEVNVSKFKVD